MSKISTGANASPYDIRNFKYEGVYTNQVGGYKYLDKEILDQSKVGICTSISLIENANKSLGTKYSPDFQYLLQKKYFDRNWDEGSSIFSALKMAKTFGFLPKKYFDKYIKQEDRDLPYYKYVKKLQSISDLEITELLTKCEKRLVAYESVPIKRDSLASAIDNSSAGILVRFNIGEKWWKPSWKEKDINPLQPTTQGIITGHAVTTCYFFGELFTLANSWGKEWCRNGSADFFLSQYAPTEAWIPYYDIMPDSVQKKIDKQKTIMYKTIEVLQKMISILSSNK